MSVMIPYGTLRDIANELKNIREILGKQSTTEQSSMVGEWIVSEDGDSFCSICGASEEEFIFGTENWYGMGISNYCPNCGSPMKGADDE